MTVADEAHPRWQCHSSTSVTCLCWTTQNLLRQGSTNTTRWSHLLSLQIYVAWTLQDAAQQTKSKLKQKSRLAAAETIHCQCPGMRHDGLLLEVGQFCCCFNVCLRGDGTEGGKRRWGGGRRWEEGMRWCPGGQADVIVTVSSQIMLQNLWISGLCVCFRSGRERGIGWWRRARDSWDTEEKPDLHQYDTTSYCYFALVFLIFHKALLVLLVCT